MTKFEVASVPFFLLSALAVSGVLFFALLPGTIAFVVSDVPGTGGPLGVLYECLAGVALVALTRRVAARNLALPSGWHLVASVLDGGARGWGVWVAVLSARVLGGGVLHFGEPSANGSYAADAFFFVVVTLLFSLPAFLAHYLARRIA